MRNTTSSSSTARNVPANASSTAGSARGTRQRKAAAVTNNPLREARDASVKVSNGLGVDNSKPEASGISRARFDLPARPARTEPHPRSEPSTKKPVTRQSKLGPSEIRPNQSHLPARPDLTESYPWPESSTNNPIMQQSGLEPFESSPIQSHPTRPNFTKPYQWPESSTSNPVTQQSGLEPFESSPIRSPLPARPNRTEPYPWEQSSTQNPVTQQSRPDVTESYHWPESSTNNPVTQQSRLEPFESSPTQLHLPARPNRTEPYPWEESSTQNPVTQQSKLEPFESSPVQSDLAGLDGTVPYLRPSAPLQTLALAPSNTRRRGTFCEICSADMEPGENREIHKRSQQHIVACKAKGFYCSDCDEAFDSQIEQRLHIIIEQHFHVDNHNNANDPGTEPSRLEPSRSSPVQSDRPARPDRTEPYPWQESSTQNLVTQQSKLEPFESSSVQSHLPVRPERTEPYPWQESSTKDPVREPSVLEPPESNPVQSDFLAGSHLTEPHRLEPSRPSASLDTPKSLPTKRCDICGVRILESVTADEQLQVHVDTFKRNDLCCSPCDRSFGSDRVDFLAHILKSHIPPRPVKFNCFQCNRGFSFKEYVNHGCLNPTTELSASDYSIENIKPFECLASSNCGRRFRTQGAMIQHIETGSCLRGLGTTRIEVRERWSHVMKEDTEEDEEENRTSSDQTACEANDEEPGETSDEEPSGASDEGRGGTSDEGPGEAGGGVQLSSLAENK